MKKILIIFAAIGLILPSMTSLVFGGPSFAFAQEINQSQSLKVPKDFDEAWSFVKKVIEPLPRAVGGVWREAVKIWQRMANWFKSIWNSKIWPKIEWLKIKILGIFSKEVEKRKEEVSEKLEKEKEEIKGELEEQASKAGKGLWERLKGIIWK